MQFFAHNSINCPPISVFRATASKRQTIRNINYTLNSPDGDTTGNTIIAFIKLYTQSRLEPDGLCDLRSASRHSISGWTFSTTRLLIQAVQEE